MKKTEPPLPNKGWVGQLGDSQFSLADAVGGWRGVAESLLPGLVFIVAYVLTHALFWPLVLSAGLALIFSAVRLVQRQPLTQAFAGAVGVGIGVLWAAASGKAENYFAWGLVTNGFFFLLFFGSLLVRRPAVGLIINWVQGLETTLGADEESQNVSEDPPEETREIVNHARNPSAQVVWATWVWVAVFGLRLVLQVPLYLTGNVVWLGVVKLVGGLPLFALGGWFTWVLLRSMFTKETRSA